MRNAFHDQLDHVTSSLVEMTRLAGSAVARATTALLDADLVLAESVIAADREIDARREELDLLSFDLLALQQPVATDLRMVVTAMRMSADIERMGDLARHIAKVARLRHPESAVPAPLRASVLQMGQVAERIVTKAGSIIAARDVAAAKEIEQDDDAMDALHRELTTLVSSGAIDVPTETVVDVTLLARYYERFADHAVSVARRVIYLVTGAHDGEIEASDGPDGEPVSTLSEPA